MPTDFLVYWLTRPLGLLLIAAMIAVPFIFWRVLLGKAYAAIGLLPLVAAYAAALAGLVAAAFAFAYLEFSSRVADGLLAEDERWSLVPGWTIYMVVLSSVFVLPVMGLVGVPVGAWLVRSNRLSYGIIMVTTIGFWLTLTTIFWAFPLNHWHQTHRLESFVRILGEFLPGVLFVAMPFLIALRLAVGPRRRGHPNGASSAAGVAAKSR